MGRIQLSSHSMEAQHWMFLAHNTTCRNSYRAKACLLLVLILQGNISPSDLWFQFFLAVVFIQASFWQTRFSYLVTAWILLKNCNFTLKTNPNFNQYILIDLIPSNIKRHFIVVILSRWISKLNVCIIKTYVEINS